MRQLKQDSMTGWKPIPLCLFMAATLCWLFPTHAGAGVIGRASDLVPSTIRVSPGGDHVLFVSVDPKTKKRRVNVDGRDLPGVYDAIAEGTPIFSEDGQHHAFVGTRGKECMVVLDGVEQTAYAIPENGSWPITALLFGSGGTETHLAYIASKGDRHYVVVNGREHGYYHSIDSKENEKSSLPGIWDLVLEGDYFAYRAMVGAGRMAAFRGRIIGTEIRLTKSKDYKSIGAGSPVRMGGMLDAEGGELFAFLAKEGPGKESIRQLPGDEPLTKKTWLSIARNSLLASPARPGEMVYITAENGQWHPFVGEKAWPPCDTHNPLIASPSGETWACMSMTDNKLVMMVNGVPGKVYSEIQHGETMFPAGDERVVYGASTLDGSKTPARIVVDGKEGKAYTQVTGDSVIFSADKKSMAYIAGDGNQNFVVLDGAEGAKFDEIYDLRFSPVGSRLAYGARRGLEHFVVDGGKELGPYENVEQGSLVFSPDGKALAWAAFVDDGNWHVCVDGKMIDSGCERVVSQLTFSPGTSVPAYVGRYVSDGKTAFALSFGGEIGREYNSIWMGDAGKLFVQEDGSIEYFARSGGLLYRAVAKAE